MKAGLRRSARLSMMVVLLFGGLLTVLVVFPMRDQAWRDRTVARWSRALLRATGIRLQVQEVPASGPAEGVDAGPPAAEAHAAMPETPVAARRPVMIVANHVSWVDIFAINAVQPSCFVAKDDIASWPLIGTLVGRVGTLFLERGRRQAVHHAIQRVAESLRDGRRIAVFPEGTTGTGDTLMPFHANLIEAAVQAEADLQPIALRYRGRDGERLSGEGGVMDFVGDISFVGSVWRITGSPMVWAEVRALPVIALPDWAGNRARHQLARSAREAIASDLGLPLDDSVAEGLREVLIRPASGTEDGSRAPR